MYLFEQTEYEL